MSEPHTDAPASTYDPLAPEAYADPLTAYSQLRERCPVHHYDGFDPPWFTLSRYDDVLAALRDVETYTSTEGQGPRRTPPGGLFSDPPEHTAFRRLLQKAFTPKAVAEMEPFVERLATELVDLIVDDGAADLTATVARPLPTITIATMLGVPTDDQDDFVTWSDAAVESMGSQDPGAFAHHRRALDAYVLHEVEQRRAALADGAELPPGLISGLVVAEDEGARMTPAEILGVIVQLLVGGNETTTSLITNALWRLMERPELLRAVHDDLDLVEPLIDESLRFDAPVLGLFRTTTCPVTVRDVEIPERTKVMVLYGSANHDAEVFDRPDEFRLDRPAAEARKHLAFGTGVHYCLGAALARLEARHALREVIGRLPNLRLTDEPRRVAPFFLWGRKTLPVAWDV